jgi:hypothetical protein
MPTRAQATATVVKKEGKERMGRNIELLQKRRNRGRRQWESPLGSAAGRNDVLATGWPRAALDRS